MQNNQLINADALVTQGKNLQGLKVIAKAKNASAADKALFAIDFDQLTGQIKQVRQELSERGVELRVARVKFAIGVLTESKDVKERFFAAFAVGIDGELLLSGFKEHVGNFGRPTLNAPGYVEALRSDVDRGKELAGDLVKKSELLFAGMHWWRLAGMAVGPRLTAWSKAKRPWRISRRRSLCSCHESRPYLSIRRKTLSIRLRIMIAGTITPGPGRRGSFP